MSEQPTTSSQQPRASQGAASAAPVAASEATEAEARAIAEEARETQWRRPSFAKELYLGRFRLDLVHPHPTSDPEDVERGEAFLAHLRTFCEEECDGGLIEREARIPDAVVKGLADLGAFGIKIPREYGGLGLSHVYYNRALELISSVHASLAALLSAHQSIGVPEPAFDGNDVTGQRGHVLAAHVHADRTQDRIVGLDALPGALLQAEQQFSHDLGSDRGQVDLPGPRDRRLAGPPGGFVDVLPGPAQRPQPLHVRAAVDIARGGELTMAGRDSEDTPAGQRHNAWAGDERADVHLEALLLSEVTAAQRPLAPRPRARAPSHRARAVAQAEPPTSPRRRQQGPGRYRQHPPKEHST